MPQDAFCSVKKNTAQEILDLVVTNDPEDQLEGTLEDLEQSISESEDPLAEARSFLHLFLEEVDVRYGIKLTIPEACQLTKNNIHLFELSAEDQAELLIALDLLAAEPEEQK
jgi:hypothetical protein